MLRLCAARGGLITLPVGPRTVLRQLDQHVMTCRAPSDHVITSLPQPLIVSRAWLSTNSSDDKAGAEKAVESTKWNIANVRRVLREYGTVAVVFHTVMSLGSLGTCYTIVNMGVDVEGFLKYFNVTVPLGKSASTMAIAYLLHKLFLPLRAAVTITAVPILVRWLRAKGIMKAPIKQS